MTEEDPTKPSDLDDTDDRDWPPSNYLILLAILLLVGAALALVISTEPAANRLATYAYYALIAGVTLRLIEHVGGERVLTAFSKAFARVKATIQTFWSRVR